MLSERTYIDKKVSHYRLLDTISSSSFCHVYRAEHLQIAQYIVAIKIFQVPSLSPQKRQQFLEEVQLLSKLKHPHILPILDAGFYEDVSYIVTDYLPDGSLRSRLSAHPLLPLQESVAILNQLGQALHYVHQRNMLYGNLKPENILFTSENKVVLTDFHIDTLADAASPEASYHSTWLLNSFSVVAPGTAISMLLPVSLMNCLLDALPSSPQISQRFNINMLRKTPSRQHT